METMRVTPAGGDRFAIALRGHEIMVDQPADVGGTDIGPTPTELFVAGLVSCVAVYAGRFLARHGVCAEGLRVDAEWEMGEGRPASCRVRDDPDHRTARPPGEPAARAPCRLARMHGAQLARQVPRGTHRSRCDEDLALFGDHVDRAGRALGGAQSAALAVVEVDREAEPRAELR